MKEGFEQPEDLVKVCRFPEGSEYLCPHLKDHGFLEVARWHGFRAMKNPYDAWLYQEIIVRRRPELIIETGTAYGGGALFLSQVTDAPVYTIDWKEMEKHNRPINGKIHYIFGDSASPETIAQIPKGEAMVILDCDREPKHLEKTLELYAPLVGREQYLIVEDTWQGHGVPETIEKFVLNHPEFNVDKNCERYICSGNKGGYLFKGPVITNEQAEAFKKVAHIA